MSPDLAVSDLTSGLLGDQMPDRDSEEKMGVDEMLRRHAGEFGPWQLKQFVLTNLAWTVYAFHTMVMIFADQDPAWRCVDPVGPGCRNGRLDETCGLDRSSWEWVEGRSWSTVSEWGLICGERYKVGLVRSTFFAGCMVGCGIFGHLSDSFLGRKGSLIVLCIMSTISSCLTALSPTYLTYLAIRALSGLSVGSIGPCAYVLATEPIGPSKRAFAGMSVFYFFSIGLVALSAMAYMIPSWRALYVACSLTNLLFILVALPFISESPRWHLIRGNVRKAMDVMESIAKRNGRHLPGNISLVLDNGNFEESCKSDSQQGVSNSIIDVIRSPVARTRLALLLVIYFLSSVVYYGINLNIGNFNTNIYLGATLNAVAEMPALALAALLVNRVGRKPLAMGTMWLSGVFCVVGSLMGKMAALQLGCGVVGIFGMAATFNLLLIYAAELFPTTVRNASLGCVELVVHIGAIVAPMVVVMGGGTALGVFGACGVVGGLLGLYLPETLNKPLYDTIAGMENGEKAIVGA